MTMRSSAFYLGIPVTDINMNPYILVEGKILWILTYLLTPWSRVLLEKLTGSQLVKKIPRILWNPKFQYRIHKCPLPVPILSQLDPFHTPTSHFQKVHPNIIFPSTRRSSKLSISLIFPHSNPVHASTLPHTCYIPRPPHIMNTISKTSVLDSRTYHSPVPTRKSMLC